MNQLFQQSIHKLCFYYTYKIYIYIYVLFRFLNNSSRDFKNISIYLSSYITSQIEERYNL